MDGLLLIEPSASHRGLLHCFLNQCPPCRPGRGFRLPVFDPSLGDMAAPTKYLAVCRVQFSPALVKGDHMIYLKPSRASLSAFPAAIPVPGQDRFPEAFPAWIP